MRHEGRILAVLPEGSGAINVHRQLAHDLENYDLRSYPAKLEWTPWRIRSYAAANHRLLHTAADYAPLLMRRGVPSVITFHGYRLDPAMRALASPLQRLHYATDLRLMVSQALRRANCITAVSDFLADLIRSDSACERDIRVIYNGVDEVRFRPGDAVGNSAFKVLYAGKISRQKGSHLLKAIAERLDSGIELLVATGPGAGRYRIEGPNIQVLGGVASNDMPELYRKVDVLLFPSLREGFGLVVAEAMASGLPVVATDCSALPELVEDGRGGILCPPGDVQAFSEAINGLAQDRILRRQMGEFNRARVETMFTARRMTSAYAALFEEVMDRGPG